MVAPAGDTSALVASAFVAIGTIPGALVAFPLKRVVNIRRGQGAIPGFKYANVFHCLYQMPAEQGGVGQIWRGVVPHVAGRLLSKPVAFAVNESLLHIPVFQRRTGELREQRGLKSVVRGAVAGGLVSLVTFPLNMASLRLQLDIGGGTLGKRTFTGGRTASVVRQIVREAGIFSTPFCEKGGLYRGFSGSILGAMLYRGTYFGMYDTFRDLVATDAPNAFVKKFVLGWCVTNTAGWVSYPVQVGVVRAQAAVAPRASRNSVTSTAVYKGAVDAMFKVASKEGIGALWRGYGLNLVSGIGGALMLVGFDYAKAYL